MYETLAIKSHCEQNIINVNARPVNALMKRIHRIQTMFLFQRLKNKQAQLEVKQERVGTPNPFYMYVYSHTHSLNKVVKLGVRWLSCPNGYPIKR